MMKKLILGSLIIVIANNYGCTIVTTSYPTTNLNLSDLEISDTFEGSAESQKVFGLDFDRLTKAEGSSIGLPIYGNSGLPIPTISIGLPVYNYALNDLIKNYPGYDVIINPKFSVKIEGFPPFYKKEHVIVKARLGKIKAELVEN